MNHISHNYSTNMNAYFELHQEFKASRTGMDTLVFLAFIISVAIIGFGVSNPSYHWLLLTYPMFGLLAASFWKHLDQHHSALRLYLLQETPKVKLPQETLLVFTFFGVPLVEMKARLFVMMSLILGSQLFSLIMSMYLSPMSQTGIIFTLFNGMGIIFSVMILSSRNELQLVQFPEPLKLKGQTNGGMNYSFTV